MPRLRAAQRSSAGSSAGSTRAAALLLLLMGVVCECSVVHNMQAMRVVQVIPDKPSSFVSADPKDPQYLVALDKQASDAAAAAAAVPPPASSRSMVMTDAQGQQFNCSIPTSPAGAPGGGEAAAAVVAAQQQQQQQQIAQQRGAASAALPAKSPFDVLDSLTGLCLYRQDGLWTYEVCHKKHVRQFRQWKPQAGRDNTIMLTMTNAAAADAMMQAVLAGDSNKIIQEASKHLPDQAKGKEDFSCGAYSGDEQQTEAVLEDASSNGHYMKYVSHVYGNGATCVLTGGPRTAEVRYTCARDVKENVVVSVKEFPSCNYIVVVSTPFLCKHPAFAPAGEDLRLISCVPLHADGAAQPGALPAAATASADGKAAAAKPVAAAAAKPAAAAPVIQVAAGAAAAAAKPAPAAAAAATSAAAAVPAAATPAGAGKPPPAAAAAAAAATPAAGSKAAMPAATPAAAPAKGAPGSDNSKPGTKQQQHTEL